MSLQILTGDNRQTLKTLPDCSVHTCVTSPPYFGLRDYGHAGQIGQEPTPEAFVAELVAVFREVRRVLREDGTLWLNLGDSYTGSGKGGNPIDSPHQKQATNAGSLSVIGNTARIAANARGAGDDRLFGMAPKNLIGIPWRVAFALQADGWYLRQDIIWHKPNPMPESVTDRCTKAHEYIFLLSKSQRYYFDSSVMKEPAVTGNNGSSFCDARDSEIKHGLGHGPRKDDMFRNKRSVWTVSTKPYRGAHFATFPPDLIRPCVLAGAPLGGTVLDPFGGSGTTGQVALESGRNAILCELNPAYVGLIKERTANSEPLPELAIA